PSASALDCAESASLPNRLCRESLSTQCPTPAKADIPDIPYLSTLIVPALRTSGIGAGLIARPGETQAPPEPDVTENPSAAPDPNRHDVTSLRSGPPQCDIVAAESPAEVPWDAAETPENAAEVPGRRSETTPARDGSQPQGRVVFVGAGPGAPDLLTQRGAAAIATADIVIWASSL